MGNNSTHLPSTMSPILQTVAWSLGGIGLTIKNQSSKGCNSWRDLKPWMVESGEINIYLTSESQGHDHIERDERKRPHMDFLLGIRINIDWNSHTLVLWDEVVKESSPNSSRLISQRQWMVGDDPKLRRCTHIRGCRPYIDLSFWVLTLHVRPLSTTPKAQIHHHFLSSYNFNCRTEHQHEESDWWYNAFIKSLILFSNFTLINYWQSKFSNMT